MNEEINKGRIYWCNEVNCDGEIKTNKKYQKNNIKGNCIILKCEKCEKVFRSLENISFTRIRNDDSLEKVKEEMSPAQKFATEEQNKTIDDYYQLPEGEKDHTLTEDVIGAIKRNLIFPPLEDENDNGQIGGNHYKKFKIQPKDFALQNNLSFHQGSIVKYVCRFEFKNGLEDLEKAEHYLKDLIEQQKQKENKNES